MSEANLAFRESDDGSGLLALWQPGAEGLESTVAVVHAALDAQGLGDFFIDDSAITTFLDTTKTAAEPVEVKIGMRCDGACSVSVSEDKMAARLWIGRAYRGTPVSDAQVRESLRQAGVVAGILEDVIAASLAAGEAADVVVATGRLPEHGVDSEFVALVADSNDRRPHADEHGIIDYRDLGSITTVKVGTPVMRRTPATAGVDGADVKGTALKAKPGKNTLYSTKLKGVAPDPADPELLCAAIVGHPVLVTNGMSVEPSIDMAKVDMSTGNVDFDGSVTVLGDVLARMKIRATGDVVVQGTVSAADITAGGQVVLLGGFKGALDEEDDAAHSTSHECKIRCTGAFHARFVEYAHVESGGDILIDDHAMFSTLISARHVVVGVSGAKGQVIGGTIMATGQVTATKFGGTSGAKTLVQVGVEPKQRMHLDHLDSEIHRLEAKGTTGVELDKLRAEATLLRQQVAVADHSCVTVGRAVYPGTEIRMGGKRWSSVDDHTSGVFRLVEDEVTLCPQ